MTINYKNSLTPIESVSISDCLGASGCSSSDVLPCTSRFLYLSAERNSAASLTFAEPLFQSGAATQKATRSQGYKFRLCPTELILEWQKGWLRKEKERTLYREGQGAAEAVALNLEVTTEESKMRK